MGYLLERDVDPDPFRQFERWFAEAGASGIAHPNAMTLTTVSAEGKPSSRTLLLKGFDADGFVFFTNFNSRKSADLSARPVASILFYWQPPLDRQIRIEGAISRVSDGESDQYFATRPRGSQVGAWASAQSEVIPDRAALEKSVKKYERQFAGKPVPRPPFWGGFRLRPEEFEFWLSQPDRLHDRLRYRRTDRGWKIERLAP